MKKAPREEMTMEDLGKNILAACAACKYGRFRVGGFLCVAGRGCRRPRVKKWLKELEVLGDHLEKNPNMGSL